MKALLIVILLCGASTAQTSITPERLEKLQAVHSIFVQGNNQGAEKIREEMEKGKTCFTSVLKASDADAVLDVNSDSVMQSGLLGIRDYIISGNLTNTQGELLWAKSVRFSDAPFSNGGKTAGKILLAYLKKQVCKK